MTFPRRKDVPGQTGGAAALPEWAHFVTLLGKLRSNSCFGDSVPKYSTSSFEANDVSGLGIYGTGALLDAAPGHSLLPKLNSQPAWTMNFGTLALRASWRRVSAAVVAWPWVELELWAKGSYLRVCPGGSKLSGPVDGFEHAGCDLHA